MQGRADETPHHRHPIAHHRHRYRQQRPGRLGCDLFIAASKAQGQKGKAAGREIGSVRAAVVVRERACKVRAGSLIETPVWPSAPRPAVIGSARLAERHPLLHIPTEPKTSTGQRPLEMKEQRPRCQGKRLAWPLATLPYPGEALPMAPARPRCPASISSGPFLLSPNSSRPPPLVMLSARATR